LTRQERVNLLDIQDIAAISNSAAGQSIVFKEIQFQVSMLRSMGANGPVFCFTGD
jgi:hypothetical protein